MKKLIATLLMAVTPLVYAADWITITESKTSTFQGLKGSFKLGQNDAGVPIGYIKGRLINNEKNTIELVSWYVTIEDCWKEEGKMVVVDKFGNFQLESDFVFGMQSAGARIAEAICYNVPKKNGTKQTPSNSNGPSI